MVKSKNRVPRDEAIQYALKIVRRLKKAGHESPPQAAIALALEATIYADQDKASKKLRKEMASYKIMLTQIEKDLKG